MDANKVAKAEARKATMGTDMRTRVVKARRGRGSYDRKAWRREVSQ